MGAEMAKRQRKVMVGPERERGAVLVISLIVLLVVTLLGVGSLETAVFQERMATNAQNKNLSFQDTASLLEDILEDEDILGGTATVMSDALDRGVGIPSSATNYADAVDPVSAEYTVTYVGDAGLFARPGDERSAPAPGQSAIPRPRFELRLTTENSDTQAGSSHIYGFEPN